VTERTCGDAAVAVARAGVCGFARTVREYYFRGDAACYEWDLMKWLRKPEREGRAKRRIGFAISVPMCSAVREAMGMIAPSSWHAVRQGAGW